MITIRNVYTVSQVNAYIKNMFTQDYMLQAVQVKGEVSNCKYHSSGHIYFTLKDSGGTMNCVMFAGNRKGLTFRLEEGLQVVAAGSVAVYERDGKYQLYVRQIVPDGTGYLYEKFELLKRELMELGMFDARYKRPIPRYISTLGVVTADTGAAIRDIIQIARRRNPYIRIILYPALVQGENAAPSIVRGIKALEAMQVDVMIVGRGGGSMEDLWAFNEREVAQAVFDCRVPVISAVGHETDTTIVDFVSDLRAPTPSAAAELAVYDILQLDELMEGLRNRMGRLMLQRIRMERDRVRSSELRLKYLSPEARIREKKTYALDLEERLQERMKAVLRDKRHKLALYVEQMKGLSPLERLNSGFSYVEDEKRQNVRSVTQVQPGDVLTIRVQDGRIAAKVQEKHSLQEEGC